LATVRCSSHGKLCDGNNKCAAHKHGIESNAIASMLCLNEADLVLNAIRKAKNNPSNNVTFSVSCRNGNGSATE
jgi:hypothetical protein